MEPATRIDMRTRRRAGSVFAWQGWELTLPPRWNPVRLEGDYARGYALIADVHGPRLGLRWNSVATTKTFDAHTWAKRAMLEEVGQLAADEAQLLPMTNERWQGSTLYTEPAPPGRDVWVARSAVSGRLVELIHHARRPQHVLRDDILPTLLDQEAGGGVRWSVFDFTCTAPVGFQLESHALNAGDLMLSFVNQLQRVLVRRIAVAELALKRLPPHGWLARQEAAVSKYYRPAGEVGTSNNEVTRRMTRRRRFAWMRWRAPELFTRVLHDVARDRLIIIQATDEQLTRDVVARVSNPC